MHRRIAALALTAAALVGLTACTAFGSDADPAPLGQDAAGDGGQSSAEACALIHETITEATGSFESAAESDPSAVVTAMKNATETLAGISDEVTNDDVAELLPDLIAMFGQTAEVMDAIITGNAAALGDLTALGDDFQDTTRRFEELCGS